MGSAERFFFELIHIAIGKGNTLSGNPSEKEWEAVFSFAERQAVSGFVFAAIEELVKHGQKPPEDLLFQWIGVSEQIKSRNDIVSQRCRNLEKLFSDNGFRCCVLKGQGTALYYNSPELRESGDIDLWVSKKGKCKTDDVRNEVLRFAESQCCHIGQIDIKHADIHFFEDVPVEIHFMPSWMFNPLRFRKMQCFFQEQADTQFSNHDSQAGFTHTTVYFDVVFSLVHIYRHVFEEGFGLRQLLDYYYILQHTDRKQREDANGVIKTLGMESFAGGVMYVLKECFLLDPNLLVCEVNERHGKFLLSEVLLAGNFGQYDSRYKFQSKEKRFSNGFIQLKRNIRFLCYYPSEVLWSPFWKLWHWCWRKKKGYL